MQRDDEPATEVRDRLRSVEDPVLESDVVELGLVDEIDVDDGTAEISVALDAPYAPDERTIADRIREEVETLGIEPSLSVVEPDAKSESPVPGVKNVVPIASGKGGVGKTTVATNLAAALAETGARVGLLDADVYGPNVPSMIGIEARPGMSPDGDIVPPEADGITLMSTAFLLEEETDPAMLRGPMVDKLLGQLIQETDWGELDYLLVDLPPGTGDEQLTLMQHVPVTGAVVVTTPEDVALADVRKGIRMFVDQDVPVLGIVENMTAYLCPDCGGEHELYGSGGGEQIAGEFDVPLLAEIPMDPEIRSSGDADKPVTVLQDTQAATQFRELRDRVTNRVGAINRVVTAGRPLSDVGDAETDAWQ
ncbi:Mrp/NBP35 family ATP-binding protein [Natronobacterium gregoryi]|uniref:Iron-sulfur cluster carrier protein n=2 Tax=Natronobacterium gregoryi TaxID=44930 RepID=L0AKK6_NATGS|nr:Mrp/NBP35 family ATP-binding protein [Natronobacterium gregoryi]AFZ74433.1 ATPase involved in chromosome partitioning [Natronobacterium gregoryi SP2]ELY72107.1 ParA/MinD ATPase-like protein [Natronobacterium gregoryi SP2]PLK19762.1 MRP family ATP-binding protein [Natronobacterium gregoryi SP2]SFJ40889.1 ATP-binding protein involved in chromosome partitioning [Natronobacterium gregoryi]